MSETLGEKWRTCSYCDKLFKTAELFADHWRACPIRIKLGYIQPVLSMRLI